MLFPSPADVDRCWGLVAEGTANRELGSAAKVAPDDDSGRARLICVYTKDFSDRADVKRVAERLKAMGLLRKKGLGLGDEDRGIYYKADAFTHLGITSGNVWGLKASLYSSKELLAGGGGVGMNGPRSRK